MEAIMAPRNQLLAKLSRQELERMDRLPADPRAVAVDRDII